MKKKNVVRRAWTKKEDVGTLKTTAKEKRGAAKIAKIGATLSPTSALMRILIAR
jgi:hypothetical protein